MRLAIARMILFLALIGGILFTGTALYLWWEGILKCLTLVALCLGIFAIPFAIVWAFDVVDRHNRDKRKSS